MPIVVREPESKFESAPEGLHVGACCDVVDLGTVETQYGVKPMVLIRWMLEAEDEQGRRFLVTRRYTASLNEKSTLRKDLETWRGRKFSAEELAGFDLERLIGVGAQIQVVHVITDNGKTFANVQAVIPLGKGQKSPGVSADYVRVAERATAEPAPF